MDFTELCFIQVGGGASSDILRWTVLKTVSFTLVGGAVISFTAVDFTDDCIFIFWGGAFFRYNKVDCTEHCFI